MKHVTRRIACRAMPRLIFALCGTVLLAACASTDTAGLSASSPAGPSVISGAGAGAPVVSGPAGCATPIAEYQQIIDRDVETGYLNPGVYNRVSTDLEAVKKACAEGRDAEARSQLASVKSRYGYR